jgi:hypothetical protein
MRRPLMGTGAAFDPDSARTTEPAGYSRLGVIKPYIPHPHFVTAPPYLLRLQILPGLLHIIILVKASPGGAGCEL